GRRCAQAFCALKPPHLRLAREGERLGRNRSLSCLGRLALVSLSDRQTSASPWQGGACLAPRGTFDARLYEGGLVVIHEGAGRVKGWLGPSGRSASRVA